MGRREGLKLLNASARNLRESRGMPPKKFFPRCSESYIKNGHPDRENPVHRNLPNFWAYVSNCLYPLVL